MRTESGDIGGVFVTCSETTDRVIGERRLRTLRDLGATATTAQDVATAYARAARVLDASAGGRITASAEPRDARVAIHVEDTGVGIAASELEHIFEPFVQLARRANRDSKLGVGLGLAISRDLARRMGGDVTATSVPGAGSRFTVLLPSGPPPA